jgi:16S rRNA (cytidine1402-2'-O)-methyltransferase
MTSLKLVTGLYLVATPIGAARDITLRALDILANADLLAAEDTRNTRRLLDIHGIKLRGRPLIAYHDHNGAAQRPRLLQAVSDGKSVAYVSDAGTPLIADPGFALSRDAIAADIPVFATPGASAILAALCVAGLPTDRFFFAGFPPNKQKARSEFLQGVAAVPATLVFYESPKRLKSSLIDMVQTLGGYRQAAVCRELTKKFEEVRRGSLQTLAEEFADSKDPKGEIVVVVGPPGAMKANTEDVDEALMKALKGNRIKDAAQIVAQTLGVPRKQVYARALELAGRK